MSAIRSVAARAQRELNQAYAELDSLHARRSVLQGTRLQLLRTGRDTQEIARKLRSADKAIGEKKVQIDEVGRELRTAVAILIAERQLAHEQARETERQEELEKERHRILDIEVDDLDLGR